MSRVFILVTSFLFLCSFAISSHALDPQLEKIDVFQANEGGHETYRIPGLVVTSKGTLLAYCEARKSAKGDWGEIDLVMRRSEDGGRNWAEPVNLGVVPKDVKPNPVSKQNLSISGATLNNPLMIADTATGRVHYLYCVNYARCFYRHSDDDGRTFSDPVEITSAFEQFRGRYDWKVIATGPGHGVRLSNGRLVVAVWMSLGTGRGGHHPSCVSTIYSDDGGKTWRAGDIVVDSSAEIPDPNETSIAELSGGRVMLNIRNESPKHRRVVSVSADGATGWSKPVFDEALIEPVCFASLTSVVGEKPLLIFANPANETVGGKGVGKSRIRLTVRLSHDDGKTWPEDRLIEEGISAYSDLAVGPDGTLYCFYERGGVNDQQYFTKSLCLARFTADWVKASPSAR